MTGHTLSAHFFLAFLRIFSLFEHKVERFMAARESLDQVPTAPVAAQDDIWVTSPDSDLAAGFTLPPGGVADERIEPPGSGRRWRLPRPDYITAGGRDLRLDLIRGFMVFAMILDHVGGESPLWLLSGGDRFFTSAAEGFVLISGFVAGMVYSRVIRRKGLSAGLVKVLDRTAALYALTASATLPLIVFSELLSLPWAQGVDLSDPIAVVISVLTLHRTYYAVDVMLLYTLLFLCSLAAFVLLNQGKGWVVLAASALVYVAYQLYPDLVSLPWPIEHDVVFHFAAWQLLFFPALWLGYHRSRIPTLGHRATKIGLVATGIGMALLLGLIALYRIEGGQLLNRLMQEASALQDARLWVEKYVISKPDLRPGRLLATGVVCGLFFLLTTRFWRQAKRGLGWLLLPLGQNALYVYVAHLVVVVLVNAAVPRFAPIIAGGPWFSAFLQIASVAVIVMMVKRRLFMPTQAARKYLLAAPLAASLAVVIVIVLSNRADQQAIEAGRISDPYHRIAQKVLADSRSGDKVWLSGPDQIDNYEPYDADPARVIALPGGPASDAEVDAALTRATLGARRVFVLFRGERAADPDARYERWLAGHAFKASEEWVGDVRFATYGMRLALTPANADAAWSGGITLSSASVDLSDVGAGDIIPVALSWTAPDAPSVNLTVFIHLGPLDGAPVAQNDGSPVAGFRPMASWRPGETITDQRGVYVTSSTPPGRYTLFVGLYDPVTGERLKLVSGADRFALGQVTVR